ncbi:hypothetical protein [Pseudoruminococcus massiliensis]|uniref:hypothetical protein n=1 Tax=Pseudoruminococcus massiliensis TaxID=2086583 RepID=UPI0040257120
MKYECEIKNKGLKQLKTLNTIAFVILVIFTSFGFTGGIKDKNYDNVIIGLILLILIILFYILIGVVIETAQRIINIEEKIDKLEKKDTTKELNNYYDRKY